MHVKRIGVFSLAKVAGCVYALMGVLIGAFFSLLSFVGFAVGSAQGQADEAFVGLFFGVGAIIVLPIFYGVLGFIFSAIGAVIYNFIAATVGGVELDLE